MMIRNQDRGATLVEYLIGITALLVVFLVGDQLLRQTGEARIDRSADTVSGMIPCQRVKDASGEYMKDSAGYYIWSLDGSDPGTSGSIECM